jgi:hypothetical protein
MSSGLICYMNWRPTDAWRPTESGDQSIKAKAKYVNHPATCISLHDALTDTVTPPTCRGWRMSSSIHVAYFCLYVSQSVSPGKTASGEDTVLTQGGWARAIPRAELCMYLSGARIPRAISVWASSTIYGVLAAVTDGCTVFITDGIQPVHGRPRRL